MQEHFPHVFPGFWYVFCHEGGLHCPFCSVMNKSCFQLICAGANCSCLSVPHSGFSRHRERISNALMAFQSGRIYLFMSCKHPTIACSTSFKTLPSVCCVVQFRGTCECCTGQLLLQWFVAPTKSCEVLGESCSWSRAQAVGGWKGRNLGAQIILSAAFAHLKYALLFWHVACSDTNRSGCWGCHSWCLSQLCWRGGRSKGGRRHQKARHSHPVIPAWP